MNERRDDEEFAGRAKALFDESVERLDAATQSRLNRGRQAALAELDRTGPAGHWGRWMPAAGIAAAAAVAVVVWQGHPVDGTSPPADSVTEFEILIGEDSIEMFEDLEFYRWMDVAQMEPGGNVG